MPTPATYTWTLTNAFADRRDIIAGNLYVNQNGTLVFFTTRDSKLISEVVPATQYTACVLKSSPGAPEGRGGRGGEDVG